MTMENSPESEPGLPVDASTPYSAGTLLAKRIIAGNPFYLISAGLLLYGVNQLTTDPRLVGAEFSMLRFNFCALVIYEIMLVFTAIALARRKVWYDALLLVGLSNVFVIVPFSLISRAVFLNTSLATAMTIGGSLLAVLKFWAFKRYIPNLRLPARLLVFGTVLLFINAAAPLKLKAIAEEPTQIAAWLKSIWLFVLPTFAALAIFLPRPIQDGNSSGQRRWIPLAFYLGWLLVTGCHLGGLGYSLSFNWNIAMLAPLLWAASWAIFLRRNDFKPRLKPITEQVLLFIPLLLPLLASGDQLILKVLTLLNVASFAARFIWIDRRRVALIQLLAALAVFFAGFQTSWLDHILRGSSRTVWVAACVVVCFFWLIFLSRDPRIALAGAIGLVAGCLFVAPEFVRFALHIGLVSLLVHSLRWEDFRFKGATVLRVSSGLLWAALAIFWLRESPHEARLPVYLEASVLSICYLAQAVISRRLKPWSVQLFAGTVLISQPGSHVAENLSEISPGFLAIAGSFLLFALGSFVAFSKTERAFRREV
jgi:hypothetical protein